MLLVLIERNPLISGAISYENLQEVQETVGVIENAAQDLGSRR